MSINGVGGAGSIKAGTPISGGGLTPDALMLYCASQLNHLDAGVDALMKKQNDARSATSALNNLKGRFNHGELSAYDPETKAAILDDFKKAYDAMPPNSPERESLQQAFHEFVKTSCCSDGDVDPSFNLAGYTRQMRDTLVVKSDGRNVVNAEEMRKLGERVDDITKDIGKGAELQMINLQSLVSQRQMAVQIATQLMSKLNETYMSIINGLK